MHFVGVLSKEYHVIANELNRMCVGLDNSVDSLDHIFMVSCPSYLNSMSDIVYKKI